MRAKIIPDVVERREPLAVEPAATAREAARLMAERKVAALLVMERRALVGIVTERDVTVRVVAAGRDPDRTSVEAIMSPDPRTLAPDDSVPEALELMRLHGFRHLPVVEDGRPVAMVSVRDLHAAVQRQLETELVNRDAWIMGLSDAWGGI